MLPTASSFLITSLSDWAGGGLHMAEGWGDARASSASPWVRPCGFIYFGISDQVPRIGSNPHNFFRIGISIKAMPIQIRPNRIGINS